MRSWSSGVVEWWPGGVVEWCGRGVVEWWSGGVVEWWSGGVVEWWSGGVVGWCAGLLLVSCWFLAGFCWPHAGLLLASGLCWSLAGFLLASCWPCWPLRFLLTSSFMKISLENRFFKGSAKPVNSLHENAFSMVSVFRGVPPSWGFFLASCWSLAGLLLAFCWPLAGVLVAS